eukprot:3727287-Pyramimonas_sp.AAC.1
MLVGRQLHAGAQEDLALREQPLALGFITLAARLQQLHQLRERGAYRRHDEEGGVSLLDLRSRSLPLLLEPEVPARPEVHRHSWLQ